MQTSSHKALGCALALGLGLAGCTLASGIGDYEVNPELVPRDLNLTLTDMGAHVEQQLDVAVVETQHNTLQARALVLMRPGKTNEYPDEHIVLERGLGVGAYKLFFFADSEPVDDAKPGQCGEIRGGRFCRDLEVEPNEHQWVKDVNPDGSFVFHHSTFFQPFTTKDYDTVGSDLVMPLSGEALTALNAILLTHNLEIRITLIAEERQVGLFRSYKRTQLFGDLRIAGIIDNGNDYRIESVVDGVVTKSIDVTAPQQGDLELKPAQISFVRKN
jgi:hypothetical protein